MKYMPVRIGAICRNTTAPFMHEGEPVALPNCRFLALLYMPLGKQVGQGQGPTSPFNRGVHDPPVETNVIHVPDPDIARRFLSLLYHN